MDTAMHAMLEEIRSILEEADDGLSLAMILYRLRMLYRLGTKTNPWPDK